MAALPPNPDEALPPPAGDRGPAGAPDPRIRQQLRAAQKAGRRDDHVEPLSADALEQPLDFTEAFTPVVHDPHAIRGYVIQGDISRGGQGAVLLATQENTGRAVAIKIMAGGSYINTVARARFEREVKVLATLQHPAIVGIIDTGRTADGSLFLVMDYIEGRDLDDHLEHVRRDGAEIHDIVGLFATIAEAVDEAHARGIVHRDLKPSNIRVDRWGKPHLLDFGLAHLTQPDTPDHAAQRLTMTGHLVGSLPWASPEQATGDMKRMGPPSDVYSLGVVMYQALTGQPPYAWPDTIEERTQAICKAIPAPPERAMRPPFAPIDPRLSRILLKCLEKYPPLRYSSAGVLAADLRAWCTGAPTSVEEPKPSRWHMLPPIIALVLICIVLAIWYAGRPNAIHPLELPRLTNVVNMEFVQVPTGRCQLGSNWQEAGRRDDEAARGVTFAKPFVIGITEVTQRQYATVMGRLPANLWQRDGNLPVDHVSWEDAMEFCRRLTQLDGRTHRLPTEAEWEYACRAGTGSPFAGTLKLDEMGWHHGNSNGLPQPVARKSPNHWGLFDMHGNVAEWCDGDYVYVLPQTQQALRKPVQEVVMGVIRGGSAGLPASDCRSAARSMSQRDARRPGVGFRVVLDPTIAPPAPGNAAAR